MHGLRVGSTLWLLTWAMAAPAMVQEPAPSPTPSSPVTGILLERDPDAGIVVLQRARAGELTLRTTPDTLILIADEPGRLADLQPGSRVEVSVAADEPNRLLARWIRDERTLAIREAEANGTPARVINVDAEEGEITVRTQAGKERVLRMRSEGRLASRIMKQGRPAALDAFQPEEEVWVSVRRTSGQALYLKGLADEATFLSLLLHPTLKGSVQTLDPDQRRLQVRLEEGELTPVRWTSRTRVFLQGQPTEPAALTTGLVLHVVERDRSRGVISARALFDEASWQAYARAVKEELQEQVDEPRG